METKTKVLLGIGAVAVLGVATFLVVRYRRKKLSDAIADTSNTDMVYYDEPVQQEVAATISEQTASSTGSGAADITAASGSTNSIGYSFDKNAQTISISAMGASGRYHLPNVKSVQQFIMDTLPEAKTEMSQHGGADGKLGNYTAKWFATLVVMYSQSTANRAVLTSKLKEFGITNV